MNQNQLEFAKNWLIKANEDIAVINELTKSGIPKFSSAICFHSQQAVEKFLKAFLAFKGIDFPKTHDVDFLLSKCKECEQEAFLGIDLLSLADFAVSVRYPDDFFTPSESDALQYLNIANTVKRVVESIISFTV